MKARNHPRVRVLTREEDAEFVECLECGEVFDSHEFTDMAIEERTQQEDQEIESRPEL
jgi:Zn ribbon nucleic-acid-binding protein